MSFAGFMLALLWPLIVAALFGMTTAQLAALWAGALFGLALYLVSIRR